MTASRVGGGSAGRGWLDGRDDWPAPAPGAAPLPRMVGAQATLELRTLLRNGEQLLLILIIPVLLLAAFSQRSWSTSGRAPGSTSWPPASWRSR